MATQDSSAANTGRSIPYERLLLRLGSCILKIGSNSGKLSTAMQNRVRDRRKLVCGLLLLWCAEAACVCGAAGYQFSIFSWNWVSTSKESQFQESREKW